MKTRSRTYVDVFGHTDLSGTAQVNQALSEKRAAAVATYLAGHGVGKARIASQGLGETAPLYIPETSETQKAANRRVEIRLVPYTRLAPLGEKGAKQLGRFLFADAAEHVRAVVAGRLRENARSVDDPAAFRVLGAQSGAPSSARPRRPLRTWRRVRA